MSNVNTKIVSALNTNLVSAIKSVKAAKSIEDVQVAEKEYKNQYEALTAKYGETAVLEAATTEDLVTLTQEYIQTLIATKDTIMSNTQTAEPSTTETKKEGLFARMKANAKAGADRTVEAAKAGHDAGKTYVMYVTDKFGRFLGIHEATTEEGVIANLKKYSKLAVYYTVYAVVAVPLYVAMFLTQFTLGLFGKSLDLSEMKAELEKNGKLVKKGEKEAETSSFFLS